MPSQGMRFAYGPTGDRIQVPRDSMANSSNVGGAATQGQINPVNPVLQGISRGEAISDPFVRELYFGSADYPGLIAEARKAAQKTFLDQPPILRKTAGLSPLEQAAIQQAYGGIGGFEPYLKAQEQAIRQGMGLLGQERGLLEEAIGATRRAGEIQQPYFAQAEQQYGAGLEGLMRSLGRQGPSAREYQMASLRGFDPRSIGAFYNPFEQQVVQQTIQDVMKAGAQQDIQQRAADIARGGESAFGSRARLSAGERQAALGRGLGEALGQIRAGGYGQALGAAQRESEFGRGGLERAAGFEAGLGQTEAGARRGYAGDILGLGQQRGALASGIGSALAGYGQQLGGIGGRIAGFGGQLGQLGGYQQQLAQQQRQELMGLGQVPRQLMETRLGREYEQQMAQRQAPIQAVQFMQGFAPQYQPGRTEIQKTYGMPRDPLGEGLAAFLGAYRGLRQEPQMGTQQSQDIYSQFQNFLNQQQSQQQGQTQTGGTTGGGGYGSYGGGAF
jgi:hypothetical protein